MRMRSPSPPRRIQWEQIQDRPAAGISVKAVEAPQDRLRVRHSRHRISVPQLGLAGYRIRSSRNTIRLPGAAGMIGPVSLFYYHRYRLDHDPLDIQQPIRSG